MTATAVTGAWTRGRTDIRELWGTISRITSGWSLHVRSSRDEAGDCFCFSYDRGATTVEVHLATSFIGKAQASRNLQELSPTTPCDRRARPSGTLYQGVGRRHKTMGKTAGTSRCFIPGVSGLTFPRRPTSPGHWTGPLVAPSFASSRHARNR